jgi:hypothetical protein
VAAWVFFLVEESRKHGHRPKVEHALDMRTEHLKPQPLIEEDWMPLVWGLMEVNIKYWTVYGGTFPFFDRENENSLLLSPALASVLFALLGGPAAIVTSWKSQEHVTCLFALRRLILEAVGTCRRDGDVELFEKTLLGLQIVKTEGFPQPESKTTVRIPRYSNSTVWINGASVAYADIVAPHVLYLTSNTHTLLDTSDVYLMDGLAKCGLLNDDFIGQQEERVRDLARYGFPITRELCRMWNGAPLEDHAALEDPTEHKSVENERSPSEVQQQSQQSRAYPECMLSGSSMSSTVTYKSIPIIDSDPSGPFEFLQRVTVVVLLRGDMTNLKLSLASETEEATVMESDDDETVSDEPQISKNGKKRARSSKTSHAETKKCTSQKSSLSNPLEIALLIDDLDEEGVFNPTDADDRKSAWDYVQNALRKNVAIKFLWA